MRLKFGALRSAGILLSHPPKITSDVCLNETAFQTRFGLSYLETEQQELAGAAKL